MFLYLVDSDSGSIHQVFQFFMASSSVQQRANSFGRHLRSRTTADSTQSGQGSEPLSDAYVTIRVEEGLRETMGQQVKAPEGSTRLDVRRSARMASATANSVQVSTSGLTLIKAPPGVRLSAGYQYEVLLSVEEQGKKATELLGGLEDMSGKVVGSWDITVIQAVQRPSQWRKSVENGQQLVKLLGPLSAHRFLLLSHQRQISRPHTLRNRRAGTCSTLETL
jgi:hypothetical protein